MKSIITGLAAILCLSAMVPTMATAQGLHHHPIQQWRQSSQQGMSSTAALAHYRMHNTAIRQTPVHAQLRDPRYVTPSSQYLGPRPTPTGPVGLGAYRQPYRHTPSTKPFAGVQPPQTTLERYWPLLLEGRQDPKTGVIVWYMP